MDYTEGELQNVINQMQFIMQRYNFRFNSDEYPIERIISIQKKLVVAYLKEYIPDIVFDVDVLYNPLTSKMSAVILYKKYRFELSLNNWRVTDD